MFNQKKYSAFTLVELIVVIVILAILATIAFLSFSSQSGSARDSVRLSDTTNIRKGLELRQAVAGVIPVPASPVVYTGGTTSTGVSGVTISQGTINASVLNTLSNGIKDPSGTEYRYSTISQGNSQPLYYQLALELENPTSLKRGNFNPFSESAFAAATDTSKVAQLKGNYSFDPSLPSLFVLSGSVTSASGGIYNPNICFVLDKSSTNTFSNKDNCVPKSTMNLKDYDSSLVGYWDMETSFSSGGVTYLKDLSGNGNYGVFSGAVLPTSTGGTNGKGLNFTGGYIFMGDKLSLNGNISITSIIYKRKQNIGSNTIVGKTANNPWKHNYGLTILDQGTIPGTPRMVFYDSGSNSWPQSQTTTVLPVSNWLALTGIYDSQNNQLRVYLNGKLIDTTIVLNKTPTISSASLLAIGATDAGTNGFYDGIIDDIKIYNRPLSDSEIYQQAKSAGF